MLTFYAGPQTSEWIKLSLFQLWLRLLGNGRLHRFGPFGHWILASRKRCSSSTCLEARESWHDQTACVIGGCPTRPFCPLANIVVLTSLVLKINILPSQCPCAMIWPSSSMKHSWLVKQTCIPWSTTCPIDTCFLEIDWMCRTFHIIPFWLAWLK